MAAGQAGFLVGLLAFSSQAFSLLTGFLVDRLGTRAVLGAGFALRIAGYVLLGLGGHFASLVAGVVGIGVGGSLLGLAIKTRLVSEDGVGPRAMLALRSTFVNIGVVAGPALGAAVYPLGFRYILGACVLSHLALGVRLLLRAGRPAARPRPVTEAAEPPDGRWGRAHWLTLLVLGVAYWAIYSQLNVVVPIAALAMTGSTAAIAVVFTVNGVLVVLCQYALLRHVFARAANRTLLALGFLFFACAYAVLLAHAGWYSLLVFALPVTLAEMLIGPSLDEQAIRAKLRAPHRDRAGDDERGRCRRQPRRGQSRRLPRAAAQRQRRLARADQRVRGRRRRQPPPAESAGPPCLKRPSCSARAPWSSTPRAASG
ncbi:MFS transporter [Amycolatopsis nalaikhensis]|uniref:MFS transporter n=1 Tax=Amycolatopsis nalaikhensis TaxID=715472 RepID=A0ABY8XEY0_9PSEU|nr:MFS transporter [Amycolatopsis sp. 2-2]WIV54168.1 MFS transporter [Amycolatopsis sp. 2-2]